MKSLRLFLFYCLILFAAGSAWANPVVVRYFSELTFDSTKWILEMRCPFGDQLNLNGWYLSSKTHKASFKQGLTLDSLLVIRQDSMSSQLFINPNGDEIQLCEPDSSPRDWLFFGNDERSMIPSPKQGQSICMFEAGDVVYLDNSPTIGQPNDTLNSMGNILGRVTNLSSLPLDGVRVFQDYNNAIMRLIATTDSSGYFSLRNIACSVYLYFERENYQSEYLGVRVYPESTVTVPITMDAIQAVNDRSASDALGKYQLVGNYPNPFNPETTISYELPGEGVMTLKIHDITGKLIKTLANRRQGAGIHNTFWDGTDSGERPVASGIYICRIEFTGEDGKKLVQARKMSLVR